MHKALTEFPKVRGVCLSWKYGEIQVNLTDGQNNSVHEPELILYIHASPGDDPMEMAKWLLLLAKGKDPESVYSDDEPSEDELSTGMADGGE